MQALDTLALNCPAKQIFPDTLVFAQSGISAPSVATRAAACTVLLVVAEGCADLARKQLAPTLEVRAAKFITFLKKRGMSASV